MVSFYSFSYAIFLELKELENSEAQHHVRGNLQFLEFDIFYCECNVRLCLNISSATVNIFNIVISCPFLNVNLKLDCLSEDIFSLIWILTRL